MTVNNTDTRNEICWYVMRAYKNEAKAEKALSGEYGLPFFIPKHYIVQLTRGKKVRRLVPAIPSILFVHASRMQLNEFKQRYPFVHYAMWKMSTGLEYMKVPEYEMNNFIKIATQTEEHPMYLQPDDVNLKSGTRIRVLGGAFDGTEGYFVKVRGKRSRRLVVKLDGVMAVSVEVSPDLIEVVK